MRTRSNGAAPRSAVIALLGLTFLLSAVSARAADPEPLRGAHDRPQKKATNLVSAGVVVFATGYAYSAMMGGLVYRDDQGKAPSELFIPVAGPWIALARGRINGESTVTGRLAPTRVCPRDPYFCVGAMPFVFLGMVEYAFGLLDPLVQATGLALVVAGEVTKPSRVSATWSDAPRPKISLAPTWHGGPGMSLMVSSW